MAVKTTIFILALVVAMTGVCLADPPTPSSIPPGNILRGRFVQERHLTGVTKPLRSEGTFLIDPNRGLIWRSERPFNIATIVTRDHLTQVVEQSQTIRLTAARAPFLNHFYNLLMGALIGNWSAVEQTFVIGKEATDLTWRVKLTPVSTSIADLIQISRVHLEGRSFVDRVEIVRTNGDWERLTFHDQTVSATALTPEDARLIETTNE